MPRDSVGTSRVIPFLPQRNATVDTLRWAARRHTVPLLLEVDVTRARRLLRTLRDETGDPPGFTAWVVGCVARAAAEHPRVHALRSGRRKIVCFDDVDVAVLVERPVGDESSGETLPVPFVVRHAEGKSTRAIHDEIRSARTAAMTPGAASLESAVSPRLQELFFRLPTWLRDLVLWRGLLRDPHRVKRLMGTVVVTSVGGAAPGVLAWGIPSSIHPLAVAIGGIAPRPGAGEEREVLGITVVFDHDVVDGAPVARFVHRLHELLTGAQGLPDWYPARS